MELLEVQKHAMTFGYIPEFNSIRYNFLKLRRMKSTVRWKPDMHERIYIQERKLKTMENTIAGNQDFLKSNIKKLMA